MNTRLGIAFDGGGMKGKISSIFSAALEMQLKQPLGETVDGLAGTSIGGIMACLFAAGLPAKQVVSFFEQAGPRIFKKLHWMNPVGWFGPQYSGTVIERELQGLLGNMTLSQAPTMLVIPSFDIRSHAPMFFKTTAAKRDRESDYELWEAARATSAAQTYFPAYQLDRMTLIDGGNIANNPAMCLYAEMRREFPMDRIRILSIGCGTTQNKENKALMDNAQNWGAVRNIVTTFDVLFSGAPELVDYQLSVLLGHDYLRVQPNITNDVTLDGATPEFQRRLDVEGARMVDSGLKAAVEFINGK